MYYTFDPFLSSETTLFPGPKNKNKIKEKKRKGKKQNKVKVFLINNNFSFPQNTCLDGPGKEET